ncbi:MAG: hypothetical protein KAH32_03010 [Chlamydiia bacterium]|nr:hypothetical protein [Chlamydiia bacterium]
MSKFSLIAEPGYSILSAEDRASICNGAGAAGDWKSALIPNTLWGLDCIQAFDLHDYAYHIGYTYDDKCRADISMLINLIRIINYNPNWLNFARRKRAVSYYEAVHNFGDDAFYTEEKGNITELLEDTEGVIYNDGWFT